MITGPQRLLDASHHVSMRQRVGTVCYYNWADDSNRRISDSWQQACFADLGCIGRKPTGTPAFMTLRIGHTEKKRPCDDAFVRFLFDRKVSPWRTYANELMSDEPMFLDQDGERVNIHSHEFRRDVGIILTKDVSRRIAINFLKAYRLLGEHPQFIETWFSFVEANYSPVDALWLAQFLYPSRDRFDVTKYWSHNIFDKSSATQEPHHLIELINMRESNLDRETFSTDQSILVTTSASWGAHGCDRIFHEDKTCAKQIKFKGTIMSALSQQTVEEVPPSFGGLSARVEMTYSIPKDKAFAEFKGMIERLIQ